MNTRILQQRIQQIRNHLITKDSERRKVPVSTMSLRSSADNNEQPEVLSDILIPENYLCYLRKNPSGDPNVYGSQESINGLINSGFGTASNIWDIDGDGDVDIMDLLTLSSNFGSVNTDINMDDIVIIQKYSSHYEFIMYENLMIDGEPVFCHFGFMEKTQNDEDDKDPPFQTIGLLFITDDGEYMHKLYNPNYVPTE